ncbi:riboflavin kinase [Mesoplasma lactucae]|uniref:riboflavin kinase n=1 Tax=Mesoplasma lactucae ATCC 49193 TaxID=81460 RepID=A0A291IR23_9MOLU|nr:riboflavin kinase [Mesoplasma lactucae]ATG97395.1 hypothetical protein CP520_01305 [Mesoplasma lactucae ATCC 49193]ATZ20152.1 riboflavin kinase/FAD synthetase [Mesoplasma lactucae ATCC 49193]MCL8216901.1 hypothetical protein [Mesoplasma lactucae ATCC 49193]
MRIVNYNPLLMMLWNFNNNVMVISNFSKWGANEDALIKLAKEKQIKGESLAIMNMVTLEEKNNAIISDDVIQLWAEEQNIDYLVTYAIGDYEQKFGQENMFNGIGKNLNVDQVVMNKTFLIGEEQVNQKKINNIFGESSVFLPNTISEGPRLLKLTNNLADGNVEEYFKDAGAYFEMKSHVVEGKHKGRLLGYPTANCKVSPDFPLKKGVYYTKNYLPNIEKPFDGMSCYWINEKQECVVETYLFNFNQEIYGWNIRTQFVNFLRDGVAVNSDEELKKLLKNDEENVEKNYLGGNK